MIGIIASAAILNFACIVLLGARGIGANRRIKKLTEYLNDVQQCLDTSRELFNDSLAREKTLRDSLNNSSDMLQGSLENNQVFRDEILRLNNIITSLKINSDSHFKENL